MLHEYKHDENQNIDRKELFKIVWVKQVDIF